MGEEDLQAPPPDLPLEDVPVYSTEWLYYEGRYTDGLQWNEKTGLYLVNSWPADLAYPWPQKKRLPVLEYIRQACTQAQGR